MMPGMNPKLMKQAMKKMGMKQEEIDATEVIIKTADKDLVIRNPQVSKIDMMGQQSFQVVGEVEEVSAGSVISPEDVKTVAEQAEVSEDKAKEALEAAGGDLAEAIMTLKGE